MITTAQKFHKLADEANNIDKTFNEMLGSCHDAALAGFYEQGFSESKFGTFKENILQKFYTEGFRAEIFKDRDNYIVIRW